MLAWFAETTIVVGVLSLVALAASRLRPISPSVRHALWLVVLIKFVTPLLVSWPWAREWRGLEWPIAQHQIASPALVAPQEDPPAVMALAPPVAVEVSFPDDRRGILRATIEADDPIPPIQVAAAATEPIDSDEVADAPPPGIAASAAAVSVWPSWPSALSLSRGLLLGWLTISVVLAIGQ